MLRFFRINDPYRLVFIFLILVLIRIAQSFLVSDVSYFGLKWLLLGEWLGKGFSMYAETFDYTGPIAAMVYKWIDILFGRSGFLHVMFSTTLIITQAGIFNRILIKNKAYDENSYLPAFLFMILAVTIPDFMVLSPQLMSLTFILITLGNVLRRIDNQVTDELFLNSGIYLGIATMLYLPSMIFFIVFLFSFILFSTAVVRRLLLYLFGFLLIFSLCALYFYWFDSLDFFVESFLINGLIMDISSPLSLEELFILTSPFILVLLLSIAKAWRDARLNNFQQKVQQVLWLMFFGGIATFFLSNEKSGHELIFFVPIISYFWTHYFILIRRKLFKLIMPLLLIFGLLVFNCFYYLKYSEAMTVQKQTEYEEGVMFLGEHLGAYIDLEINTPCFQQELSELAFEKIDHYFSAGVVYKLLKKSNPTYIIDEIGAMPHLKFRYPFIEHSYKKVGLNTYERISN